MSRKLMIITGAGRGIGRAVALALGAAAHEAVHDVALVFFGLAAVAGILVTVISQQWWFLAVGAVAIVAAWFYTGGKRPYGYAGFGELAVFVFFGLVATQGTAFVQGINFYNQVSLGRVFGYRMPGATPRLLRLNPTIEALHA